MPALTTTAKRTLTTLIAWLALLCAQLSAVPDLAAPVSRPTAIAAPAQIGIARPESGSMLVKTERGAPHAKQGAGPDLLPLSATVFRHPERAAERRAASKGRTLRPNAPSSYRARAPPVAGRSTDISNLS